MRPANGFLWLLSVVALCSGSQAAAADGDKSQLKTADVNSLFPGGARAQPLPLPLGPAYNSSDFKAYANVTFQMYTDQSASGFAVNQSFLSMLVNQLGQLYYPQGVLFEVLDLVAANANDSMVDCTLPNAGGNWGICASMLMLLQDDTKATFVKSTLVNVDVANGQGVPSGGQNLAYALSRLAASLGASLMWEACFWLGSEAVPQADVLQPPLLQPVYSFWSPIPTRTRTMTAQLQGNQILPFPGYQRDASLGAIKKSLANVATYVALDGVTSSNQAAGRKLMASRMTPYVNITFDFDCFASLSLPTTLSDWQVLSPELLKNLQAAGVPVDAVQIVAVNFTTPADLIAAQATAAINAPPSPTDADRAVLNSVAAATNLTKALTDSMSQALSAFGYSPGTAGGAGASSQSQQAPGQAAAASVPRANPPPYGPAGPVAQAPAQAAAAGAVQPGVPGAPGSPAGQAPSPSPPPPEGIYYKLFANAPGHGKYVPLVAGLLGGFFVVLLAVCITVGILYHRRRRRRRQAEAGGVKEALRSESGADEDPYHALMLSSPTNGPNADKNAINSLGGGGDSMAYVSLGSRKRSLGGASALGGSGGGTGGGSGTAFSSGALGTSMMGMARSTSTASDSMKPPPGYTPAASVIAPQDLTICKKSDGSDFLLGQGTFGAVYKAMRRHVQECAVKILRNVNEDELTNFQREVYIMQQCSFDRNIVQFYGFCTSPPMLVLEFMEGGDLWSALRGPHRDELQWYGRGRALALDIARGLHFLHEHKVVHADMKTKNILLSAGRMTAKIADVGLARYMAQTHMDTKSLPMGTFVYAAPELLLGRRSDHKVDIYSVGIILWELVTLMTPARGNLRSVKVPEECPADVAHLIEDCLNANNPDERPTASQIYDRLISSAATVEEAHDRMLHPERYEKTEEVLTLTPSGETEFNTAQAAGSTGASLADADMDAAGQVAPAQASDELWDDSFKPPSTLQRSNSPTSTLADRFASAESWSGTEAGNGDSIGAGSGVPDSEYGTPDTQERQASLTESSDALGKSMSAPSGDSLDGDDASGSSTQDGHVPAAQSSGSSAAPASAKQLVPGPSLDVIREDEEHGPRRLSPGSSLHSIEERDDDDFEEQHELDPSAGHHSDGEEGASDYDDDAVSEASSEALALAVATEEAVKEEEEAAKAPSQPRQGLTRLGSLLPRRAEAGQEGEPRLPGAPSLGKSLGRLGSMLPRRRPDSAAQDASDDDCDAEAAFASKPPLAKMKSISKGWTRVGTLLPIIGHRSNASTVAEPSSDGSSLRASFNRQALDPDATSPARVSFEEKRQQQEPARSATPGQSVKLPRRPSMPSTPTAQPALRPAYTSSTKPASSSNAPSPNLSSDVSGSSPSPYRAHFEPSTSTSDDELSPPPAHRLPSIQSGYAASKELSADEAPPRVPNRPVRLAQRPQPHQAMRGDGTPAAASPEVPFVPSVTIKKDVTQTLGANFWASAADASYDSQRAATPPAAELPSTQRAPESPGGGHQSPMDLPAARPPPAVAAAANFWEAASAAEPAHELPSRNAGSPGKSTGLSEAEKEAPAPASPAGQRSPMMPRRLHAPTPSTKLAASNFWQKAAERTFSYETQPEEMEAPPQAASPADDRIPPRAAGPERMSSQPLGGPAASGKRASARHLAARLRQQAAVRQSSLAAVMSGSVPLKEAASIRDTALRAVDETGEGSPEGAPNGQALWRRAKSIAVNGPEQEAAPASRSRSINPGLVSTRTKDLWMRGRTESPTSEDASLQGASMQAQDSPSSLSVLISDGSRQLSNLSSPFVSVLPWARNAGGDKSDAERADEDLAQQLFRAAQARQKRQST